LRKKGPMTHAAHEAGGFIKTRPELDRPDAQIGVSLYSMDGDGNKVEIDKEPGLTIGGYFLRPQSQGEVRIQSADATVPPRINANYLSAEIDRTSAIALFRWFRRLAAQPVLKPFIVGELTPGPEVESDAQILAAFRRSARPPITFPGPVAWVPTARRCSIRNCVCAASRACVWSTLR